MSNKIFFNVLIDDTFANICNDEQLTPIQNKFLLSLINDFEDGEWRYKKFQNFIWDNIAQTSLSEEERRKLVNNTYSQLFESAKNLRLCDERDKGAGSEIAEIVLYGIMKNHFNALPIVPKIFYKQNTQDNAKGADSVHIVLEGENDFSLWLGEAKFYNSLDDDRLDSIVSSVYNTLQTDKLKKENSIITNVSDIDSQIPNKELCIKIKNALSPQESIDNIKPKINVPILLLHECKLTKNVNCLSDEYTQELKKYHEDRAHKYFKKQIEKHESLFMYEEIKFHLILFPVPEKKVIVERFLENAKNFRK